LWCAFSLFSTMVLFPDWASIMGHQGLWFKAKSCRSRPKYLQIGGLVWGLDIYLGQHTFVPTFIASKNPRVCHSFISLYWKRSLGDKLGNFPPEPVEDCALLSCFRRWFLQDLTQLKKYSQVPRPPSTPPPHQQASWFGISNAMLDIPQVEHL
jgi:hypothetical protein